MALPESTPTEVPSEEAYPSVHLLILITGSVAAIKTGLLLDQLSTERCNIRIAATKAAFHFLRRAQPSRTGIPFQSIITDEQEWSEWQAMNDAVVHIELRQWADLVVIAPLNANTLAKMASGICDNLVSSVMRAWEVKQKPVILCPAMNTAMWMHPITSKQLGQMQEWYCDSEVQSCSPSSETIKDASPVNLNCTSPAVGALGLNTAVCVEKGAVGATDAHSSSTAVTNGAADESADTLVAPLPATLRESMCQIVGPVSKHLACGDVGIGGMASVEEIALHIRHTMKMIRDEKRRRLQETREQRATEGQSAPSA
ncbi:hypothetical protein JKF63_02941 [Porcisia hertigi]|uniref:Flavoprotein domain-containing protein n=1 Tax=Porcisia hertigi TaxID=2761500 RepID=A0A836IMH7_9TRYP|nr:hypothetical protein JKF63_02941 [Porcisia hertigi]